MRILVTGGAGFIGSHLCDALVNRGDEVCCFDNLYLGRRENIEHLIPQPGFRFVEADLLDRDALDRAFAEGRFDAVFHLAANSDIQRGSSDLDLDARLTFSTTFETLKAMHRHGVRQFVLASTSAVFGDTSKLLSETSGPMLPVSFYGASKMASEAFLSVFANSYDFQAYVLRFPNVVGERCTHGVIHDFIERLRRDSSKLDVLGDGGQTKPYLYVGDLVGALLLVFERGQGRPAVYHVAGEGLTSVSEIADIVVEEMGLCGIPIVYSGGKTGWLGDVPYFNYDVSKIRTLGFRPRYHSTEAVRVAVQKILSTNNAPAPTRP